MSRLRLLTIRDGLKYTHFPWGHDLLPMRLRRFTWDGYPLKSLPSPYPGMLMELSMRSTSSDVEKLWSGALKLPNLEKLDLSYSERLIECPNLSSAPNLKYVELAHCRSLPLVDASTFSLQKLEVLSVSGCVSLKSLCPATLVHHLSENCMHVGAGVVSISKSSQLHH